MAKSIRTVMSLKKLCYKPQLLSVGLGGKKGIQAIYITGSGDCISALLASNIATALHLQLKEG